MTGTRREKKLSALNKPFIRKKVRKPSPVQVKAIQLVSNGKKSMKTCSCGSKLFDRSTECCIVCKK